MGTHFDSVVVQEPSPRQIPLLEMVGIEKHFGSTAALKGVSFDVHAGEVHCLVGENGAGKSTLIKIMAGSYQPDNGKILVNGSEVKIRSPHDGLKQGIGVVYQELELVPDLTIMGNIFLGREPLTRAGMLDWNKYRSETSRILKTVCLDLPPETLVSKLTVAQSQLVAIAKVLVLNPSILVLDEPSTVLTGSDLTRLFDLINRLRSDNVGIIYISHRLEEIFKIGDRVTVLRDGNLIMTTGIDQVTEDSLIEAMVNKKPSSRFPPRPVSVKPEVIFRVENLQSKKLKGISFELHEGEILGCTGLAGCGAAELANTLIGIEPFQGGHILINGKSCEKISPRRALKLGVALVPEDRKKNGLVQTSSIWDNICFPIMSLHSHFDVLDFEGLHAIVDKYKNELNIKAASMQQQVSQLSGGNQQKVVVAKALAAQPCVFVLDEPTRGIDIGAKSEIYQLIVDLASIGSGVLLLSSELVEVTSLAHNIIVLSEGAITAEVSPPYNEEEILRYALPKSRKEAAVCDDTANEGLRS